jgi:DNA-binding NarL/FixJ family response regulator
MFRAGIHAYLKIEADLAVVGEAGNAKEALKMIEELHPDIVIMDISMTGMDGLSATRLVKGNYPQTKVILLTQHENREYILKALKLGAEGYVVKRAAAEDLILGIRQVYEGQSYLDSFSTDVLVQEYREKKDVPKDDNYESLSEREREVLLHLTNGCSNKACCTVLKTEDREVATVHPAHVKRIICDNL